MRALPIAVLGIAAYAVLLALTVPARYLAARLEDSAPGRYQVREAEGTLWHGSAKAVLRAPGGALVVERVQWDFLASRLASGRLAFAIDVKGAGFEARYELARSLSGWGVRDLAARADAAIATLALPWLAHWRPEGTVSATAPAIDVAGNDLRGTLAVEWKGAAVAHSQVKPLGSWRAEVRAEGGAAKVRVATLDGPLNITGQGTLTLPARLAFTGEARAEGADARALEPLMNLLGPAKPDGTRTLDWRVP